MALQNGRRERSPHTPRHSARFPSSFRCPALISRPVFADMASLPSAQLTLRISNRFSDECRKRNREGTRRKRAERRPRVLENRTSETFADKSSDEMKEVLHSLLDSPPPSQFRPEGGELRESRGDGKEFSLSTYVSSSCSKDLPSPSSLPLHFFPAFSLSKGQRTKKAPRL